MLQYIKTPSVSVLPVVVVEVGLEKPLEVKTVYCLPSVCLLATPS